MEIFTETAPAVSPEILEIVQDQSMGSLASQIINLKEQIANLETTVERAQRNHEFAAGQVRELRQKIDSVDGFMRDYYSENGEMNDDLEEIARLLGIELTKEISGTSTFEISWTARVPLDYDVDSFEISFDVNCEEYDAEDFEWNEENTETNAEEV